MSRSYRDLAASILTEIFGNCLSKNANSPFVNCQKPDVPDKEVFYGGQVRLAQADHLDICGKTQENLPLSQSIIKCSGEFSENFTKVSKMFLNSCVTLLKKVSK